MAEISTREMHLFISSTLHALRAPLSRIYCAGQELRDSSLGSLDETGRFFAESICQGSEEMEEAFAGLSDIASVYDSVPEMMAVPVESLLQDVLEGLRELFPGREVTIRASALSLYGDRSLLLQAVLALVENAIRFSSPVEGAVVEVSVAEREDGKEILVADSGVGFDMARLESLFVPFGRLHRKEGLSGQGMGLALVKAVAVVHGGSVGAEGVPGKGASFRLFLPDQK